MLTTVKFLEEKYGNYQDTYYTNNYAKLLVDLESKVKFTQQVNLGFTDGVILENTFTGDFNKINCAIVVHETNGTHLYKIIKKSFIRKNMWRITMVKDLISALYGDIINSKVLVSRLGIDRKVYNPLLFINEGIKLSEIKVRQDILKEDKDFKTYGYLLIWARDSLDGINITWESKLLPKEYDISVDDITLVPELNRSLERGRFIKTVNVKAGEPKMESIRVWKTADFTLNDFTNIDYKVSIQDKLYLEHSYKEIITGVSGILRAVNNNIVEFDNEAVLSRLMVVLNNVNPYGSLKDSESFYKYNNKRVFDKKTNRVYEITLAPTEYLSDRFALSNELCYSIIGGDPKTYTIINPIEYDYEERQEKYNKRIVEELPIVSHTFKSYVNCIDQPLQIMYIPMIEFNRNDITIQNSIGQGYNNSREMVEGMLYDLISKYGGTAGKLLDVQVVSYSPCKGFPGTLTGNTYKILNEKETIRTANYKGLSIYEVQRTNYFTTLRYNIKVDDYKISQNRKYLITSPSGSSVYEFSVAKNGGLEGFLVETNIRPYASFNRIQPIFKNIYGANYVDSRGLVWKEDTSLTSTSNAWETYKRQNVNFQNSFNCDIDYKRSSMALNQEANRGNYGFDAGKRIISATVDAAVFGAEATANDFWGVKGVTAGALGAGAILGGALLSEALEAGQLAYNNRMEEKMNENEIDNARKQFNYSLGNIKALPENVEKVSGVYTTNNLLPYIQVFEPSKEEEKIFNDYLDMFGVNVGLMVDLSTLKFNFLQGTVVKFYTSITNEEYKELYAQLKRGARLYEEV